MIKKDFKYGFSLTELLVSITIMAVLSLLVVFAITKKTQKTLSAPKSGKIICYKDIDGKLHQKSEIKRQKDGKTEIKDEIVENKCVLDIPASATNVVLYVIGAGGGGAPAPTSNLTVEEQYGINVRMNFSNSVDESSSATVNNQGDQTLYTTLDTIKCDLAYACVYDPQDFSGITSTPVPRNSRVECAPLNEGTYGTDTAKPKLSDFEGNPLEILKPSALNDQTCAPSKRTSYSLAMQDIYKYFDKNFADECAERIFGPGTIHYSMFRNNYNGRKYPDYFYPNYLLLKELTLEMQDYKGCTNYWNSYDLFVQTESQVCYCGNGGNIKCSNNYNLEKTGQFFNDLRKGNLLSAQLETIKKINGIPLGNPGANGVVIGPQAIGSAYAGKTIIIKRDDIGKGGAIGGNGGNTKFKDDFGVADFVAMGGNAGTVALKPVDLSEFSSMELGDYEKLGSDGKLKQKSAFSLKDRITITDPRENNGLSGYYIDNASAIVNTSDLILPNSTCTIDSNGKIGITKYNPQNNNYYNQNYGGGGGGYIPCVTNYGYITGASITPKVYTDLGGGAVGYNESYKLEYDQSLVTPKAQYGVSTKGMGGAVIIQWGK